MNIPHVGGRLQGLIPVAAPCNVPWDLCHGPEPRVWRSSAQGVALPCRCPRQHQRCMAASNMRPPPEGNIRGHASLQAGRILMCSNLRVFAII